MAPRKRKPAAQPAKAAAPKRAARPPRAAAAPPPADADDLLLPPGGTGDPSLDASLMERKPIDLEAGWGYMEVR